MDRRGRDPGGRPLAASLLIVAVAVAVGAGIGFGIATAFHDSSNSDGDTTMTEVVTATVTEDSGPDVTGPNVPAGEAVSCAPGPSAKKKYEPNETPGDAAGPLASDEAQTGRLGQARDIDHWAICVDGPVEVTLSLECRAGDCGGLFGTFPAGESFATDFDAEEPLTCRLPERGRYVVAIDSQTRPVNYGITVSSPSPDSILTRVEDSFPDAELGEKTC